MNEVRVEIRSDGLVKVGKIAKGQHWLGQVTQIYIDE